jgi:predicted short-subunit dehydrogenase-like oxidoreductase (DUF2520 family)
MLQAPGIHAAGRQGIAGRVAQHVFWRPARTLARCSTADEIEKLDRLKKAGSISDAEFTRLRAKLVA